MLLFEILIIIIFVVFGFQFPRLILTGKGEIKEHLGKLSWLWAYHIFFGIVFYFYISAQGGSDALKYWRGARYLTGEQAVQFLVERMGTRAMYALNYIPSNLLDLSFFTGSIIYCFIGFMGLTFFYKIAITLIPYNYRIKGILLFPTIFYLPNLHFWSGSVGKDSLLFFCVGLFAYSLLNLNKRLVLIVFSLLLAYVVRPHIALFLVISFSMAYLMNNKLALYKRTILFIMLFGVGIAMLPSVLQYTQIEELSVDAYEDFSETKSSNLSRSHTGSSVDMSSYPLPLKLFTFLYRPTFIDITSATALLAAIENLILLILSIVVFRRRPIETFKRAPFLIKGFVFLLIIGTVAFSMSMGNLGIMLRMRNMFLPGMLIFICWSYSYYQARRIRSRQLSDENVEVSL